MALPEYVLVLLTKNEYDEVMRKARDIECWLTDMDGVLVHEEQALPVQPN